MSRLLPVLRREYLERVRSRAFLVSTVLGPLLMAGMMLLPGYAMSRQRGEPLKIAVLDLSKSLAAPLAQDLAARQAAGRPRFAPTVIRDATAQELPALRARVLGGELDGYLVIPQDVLTEPRFEYHGRNVSNVMDLGLLNEALVATLLDVRLSSHGLGAADVKALTRKPEMRTIRLSAQGAREDRGGVFVLALLLSMMLYTTLLLWGAAIMNGVLEEKTNRVVEVVVSSIAPSTLFFGKLVGVGAAGFTQFVVWAGSMLLLGLYASVVPGGSGLRVPEVPPLVVGAFVVYFVLGFFVYGAMYAALGAAVNTQQEGQSLSFIIGMPLILALMFASTVLGSPDSTFSVVLSLIPFFTPLLMMMRITAVTPPLWQLALSVALLLATIGALTTAAARVYRVGILMHGKRPTLPEMLRWMREG